MKKLAVIAITGLGVATICLVAVAAIGVKEFSGGNFDFSFGDGPDCAVSHATANTRTLAWDGDDSVTVEVPATIHYQPGTGTQVVLKGEPDFLSHVRVKDGHIDTDCSIHGWHGNRIDITLPGRAFREYHLEGLADLNLVNLAQDKLKITLAGKGDVTATGKADDLDIDIAGSGDTHLKDLAVKTLKLDIAGRGDVDVSPQDDADISIAGSGTVRLYSEPKHLDTSIMGSGNVEHLAGKN
jgi:hypothetical protein